MRLDAASNGRSIAGYGGIPHRHRGRVCMVVRVARSGYRVRLVRCSSGRPGNRGQIRGLRSGFERGIFPMRQPVIGRFDMGRVLFLDIAFEFNQTNNNHDNPEIQKMKIVSANFLHI